MQILTKYVFFKFLRYELLATVSLLSLYALIDFLNNSDNFIPYQADARDILLYYFYLMPHIFTLMAPYTVLFSTISCISSLSKNNEIIAMRACGKSLFLITTPILLSSLFLAFLIVVSNELITPYAYQKTWYISEVKIHKKPLNIFHQYYIHQHQIWYRSRDNIIWNIGYLDVKNKKFKDINIYYFDEEGKSLTKWISAAMASHDGKDWVFEDGSVLRINGSGKSHLTPFKGAKFQFDEKPEDFFRTIISERGMSISSIHRYRLKLRKQGIDSTEFDVNLHCKISYPFICIIMALMGIPLSFKSGRSGGLMFSVVLSFFIGWIYFYVFSSGISFGHRGILPPWLAAWGINMIGITFGLYMISTMDSDSLLPSIKKKA